AAGLVVDREPDDLRNHQLRGAAGALAGRRRLEQSGLAGQGDLQVHEHHPAVSGFSARDHRHDPRRLLPESGCGVPGADDAVASDPKVALVKNIKRPNVQFTLDTLKLPALALGAL